MTTRIHRGRCCISTSTACSSVAANPACSTHSSLRPIASNFSNGRRFAFGADGCQRDVAWDGLMGRAAFQHAGARLNDPRWRVLDLIEPATWRVSKIEAIDPASNFWWLDDDPTELDRDWLRAHGRLGRLIEISSDRNPEALRHARSRRRLR
jgi:hypothetical protein